jgi:hypothetical protein
MAMAALLPPKPNELDNTVVMGALKGAVTGARFSAGSTLLGLHWLNDAAADSDGGHHGFDGAGCSQAWPGPLVEDSSGCGRRKGVDGARLGQIVVGCAVPCRLI